MQPNGNDVVIAADHPRCCILNPRSDPKVNDAAIWILIDGQPKREFEKRKR